LTTFTAFSQISGKAQAEALGTALEALEPDGVAVFEIEDGSGSWEVGGYFSQTPDDIALALLAAAHGGQGFVISELAETDWVAKVHADLAPVEAGRFFVYGSHDADKLPADRVGLRIEAALAFGTGHHGTTLGCLQALEAVLASGGQKQNIADIGCGTAVLAMAAAFGWPEAAIIASDIDPVAVEVAEANLVANGLSGKVKTVLAAGLDAGALATAAPYDLIFANILKGPLIALAPSISAALCKDGQLILSGILNVQADEIIAVYAGFGINLQSRSEIVDWTTLTLIKSS